MIFAVPEVVSYLLLRKVPQKGQSDAGVFDLLSAFDHIVFDEFHTISPRGFGLAGLFAKLAAEYPCRAKVSFLSATPIAIAPVLRRLDVDENAIAELHEEIGSAGRVIHGDVRLCLCQCGSIPDILRMQRDAIREEVSAGRQAVVIYNALADLQRHLPELEAILRQAGIRENRALLVDSLDDSRTHIGKRDFFAAGRYLNPEDFDVLIATASVEMGVTFKANLLIMEPGFEALNFLQRYGRAARGDFQGQVAVRVDETLLGKNPWLRTLKRWVQAHQGETLDIRELSNVLSQSVQKRFKDCPEGKKYFGRLPNRSAYTAGLYWNVLMQHFSNKGHRWKHLQAHQPKVAGQIHRLLKQVREMAGDRLFGEAAADWCARFEQEARTLRDIGKGIRLAEDMGAGEKFFAQEIWLRRNTDILDRFPLVTDDTDDDGTEEVRIKGKLADYLLDKKNFVKAVRNARFPHSHYTALLKDDAFLVESWCQAFRSPGGAESVAWELYPESMEAAEKLVRLTGLIVCDETEPDAGAGVL